ncbi:lysozyme inhibitor LprI family protein [Burkholderia sp. Ac-20379]|uniref:lysozyme inhibitor LprI family protein n=1 Tax=Burkholderia sp. Ac-20379 TaxID=2703900 RepID=UPI00197F4E0E|nr:lysozyme inhibitor LprI family protein [Burkholderia sp. Ac-20379]MBN3724275.1 DUF1311 domain-containing protein [Burkholderia sp. Ac-20379]
MKGIAFALALCASTHAFAECSPADEIATRSGLPVSRIQAILQDCDANQTSMNFCAWRDQLVAERELQQAIDRHSDANPDRQRALESKMAKWKKARDASCDTSAREEWGSGSMRPAARATCATAATKAMTAKLASQGSRTQ